MIDNCHVLHMRVQREFYAVVASCDYAEALSMRAGVRFDMRWTTIRPSRHSPRAALSKPNTTCSNGSTGPPSSSELSAYAEEHVCLVLSTPSFSSFHRLPSSDMLLTLQPLPPQASLPCLLLYSGRSFLRGIPSGFSAGKAC